MRVRGILCGLGAAAVAAAAIGCGGPAADVSTAKPGPAQEPPADAKKLFEKPAKVPGGAR